MIAFLARDGQRMFAFGSRTDPTSVLTELAWAYSLGQKLCDLPGCPATEGGYCLECHMYGAEALETVKWRTGQTKTCPTCRGTGRHPWLHKKCSYCRDGRVTA
jgi:hypothetical protein